MVANLIQAGMEAVENKLRSVVDSDIQLLTDASRHIIASGGNDCGRKLPSCLTWPPGEKNGMK